jgi:putative transposase
VLIQKGFKFRLYPTKEQEQKLLQQGGNARFLWNYFLKQNEDYYKETKKFKFYYELAVSLPKLKEEYKFLEESFSQSLQMVARQFDRALKDFIRKGKRFPVYKKKVLMRDSFTCPQTWRVAKGFVFIPKIGEVRWVKHRPLQGKPQTITISQDGTCWYCSVLCEYKVKEQEKKSKNVVGCDVGLKVYATLSDGTVIDNPKHLKKYEKKLAKEQRKLLRKQKGSKNKFKQRMKVRKIQVKVRNVRRDFTHKSSNLIVKNYDGVVREDLGVKGMMSNHCLAKAIADVAWFEFDRQLEYKCRWNFKHYIEIGRFEPTSRKCSLCGHEQEMPLDKRQFKCENCGMIMDRDLNAAINIRNIGINTLGHSGLQACGVETMVSMEKQEKESLVN